MEGRIVWIREG